jgi:hypothetical protein
MLAKKMKRFLNRTGVRAAVIFVVAYFIFLVIWIGVKDYYGRAVTSTATYFITAVKQVNLVDTTVKDDVITVSFMPKRHRANVIIDIDIVTSSYTFNAPLTFAIMAAFYPYLGRKKVYIEVLSILFIVHILYIFSSEGEKLTTLMIEGGYEEAGSVKSASWQFLWGFIDNMVIRFEPFLLGAYLYFRRGT